MIWLAEISGRRGVIFMAGMVCAAMLQGAPATTNDAAPELALDGSTPALPGWLETSVLATNAGAWVDLADTWQRKPDVESSPVENLTLPIEHYDDGRIRALLRAGKAAVGNAGLIWSWQVKVDLFDPAGAPDGRIEAQSCLYDRNARRGYCPESVTLVRSNVTITGTGMYWTMAPQRMQILSNAVVRMQQGIKRPGAGASLDHGRMNISPTTPHGFRGEVN